MKSLNRWIFIIPIINIVCIIAIQPMVIAYFGMTSIWKIIYIIAIFGSPIWVLIPILILMLLFAAWPNVGHELYWVKWKRLTLNSFMGASISLLVFNLLILFSQWALKNEPFPKSKYIEITDRASDCSDIRDGIFETNYRYMVRNGSVQTEYSKNYKDTFNFSVTWLSNWEYRLINVGKGNGMNDTLDIKITHNTPEYYEGFLRLGAYAKYYRVMKIKRPQ
ncbi:MAG: hypothetical protein SGJ00_11420 [bacterium]|nr:hypothetical protein [bacterium]